MQEKTATIVTCIILVSLLHELKASKGVEIVNLLSGVSISVP